MDYLAAGLLGVLVGAVVAAGTALLILQRAVDRDLVERRMRALLSYREILGTPPGLEPGSSGSLDPLELDQLIHNLEAVARELRLTAWIFDEPIRRELAGSLLAFEEEVWRSRQRRVRPSSIRIVDSYRQFELTLRQAASRNLREFRRWRFWPQRRARRGEGDSPSSRRPPLIDSNKSDSNRSEIDV